MSDLVERLTKACEFLYEECHKPFADEMSEILEEAAAELSALRERCETLENDAEANRRAFLKNVQQLTARADAAIAARDEAVAALEPFANLDMPADEKWTTGTFLIDHADIRRARSLTQPGLKEKGR